ncbi:MAG: exodeoxyribonuclease VII small subunit [Desulfuromonadales bacterium]|nr:exodeoxyribonuclease VII small subunit [Desulfuromonadales bacterium]
MPIAGSPKKLAQDIADGYLMLSPPMLKTWTPADIKTILANLAMVVREIRGEQIPLEDVMALKARNMKLSRLNQAEVVIRAHCKKRRIPI